MLAQRTSRSDAEGAAVSRSHDGASRATALLDEVERLLRARNKIAAIKVYRTATGTGLKEAKDTVDAIEKAMGLQPLRQSVFEEILGAIRRWRGDPG
jgi:ribosomal protein L7/L12